MQFSLQQRLHRKFHYLYRSGRCAFIAPGQGPHVALAPEETAAMVRKLERREERIARLGQAYAEMEMTPKSKGSVPELSKVREVPQI